MYYLTEGLHQKWLGVIYSVLIIFSAFGVSAIVDSNTIATALEEEFSVARLATGIGLAVFSAIVIFGGIKRIGLFCEKLGPFMAIAYLLCGLAAIIIHIQEVPAAIVQIVEGAFYPSAVTGGIVGSVFVSMRYGMARGIFSNEAGLGTAAMMHSNAKTPHPCEQGLWGPVEIFLDTAIVCSVSAILIVLSGLWDKGEYFGAALTMRAFEALLPSSVGLYICVAAVLLFGGTCLITFNVYVERGVEYIANTDKFKQIIRTVWVLAVVFGAISEDSFAWDLADTFNGLLIIPNLIGLVFLSGFLAKMKNEYYKEALPVYIEKKKQRKEKA